MHKAMNLCLNEFKNEREKNERMTRFICGWIIHVHIWYPYTHTRFNQAFGVMIVAFIWIIKSNALFFLLCFDHIDCYYFVSGVFLYCYCYSIRHCCILFRSFYLEQIDTLIFTQNNNIDLDCLVMNHSIEWVCWIVGSHIFLWLCL